MKLKNTNLKKYTIEFLSIFIAVISAFALNNWNDNRKDDKAESKILTEILNGLKKDKEDVALNMQGHENGIKACEFWRKIFNNKKVNFDSLNKHYRFMTRDFISIQNTSGYEALKSRGFELIKNDSLRALIISLYEFNYQILEKLEEEYDEMQFYKNYFHEINSKVAPHFVYDSFGRVINLNLPINVIDSERKIILNYIWKIQDNRTYIVSYYSNVLEKIDKLIMSITEELKN